MPYGVPFDSEDSVASRRPKPPHTLVSARNNTMHTTVSEANAVFTRLASCCTVNGAKPRRYSEGMSFAMRTRNPDKLKNNSAVPAHTSTTDAVNWGDRSIRPLSTSNLYALPIMTNDTANRASETGMERSFCTSTRLEACIRSMNLVRETVRTFSAAARAKMAPNTHTVCRSERAENTNARP